MPDDACTPQPYAKPLECFRYGDEALSDFSTDQLATLCYAAPNARGPVECVRGARFQVPQLDNEAASILCQRRTGNDRAGIDCLREAKPYVEARGGDLREAAKLCQRPPF